MESFFITIYNYLIKNKIKAFGIIMSLLLVLFFFASKISFQENITQLIPSTSESDITSKVLKQVNFADKITILIKMDKKGEIDDNGSRFQSHPFVASAITFSSAWRWWRNRIIAAGR